jgi:hypothetical protein
MKNIHEFLKEFSSPDSVSRFRHGVSINAEHGEERVFQQMIDALKERVSDVLYANGEDIVGEIKILSQPLDFNHQVGVAVDCQRQRVFPPTIGRYIGYLMLQYNALKRTVKFQEKELDIERIRIRELSEKIVKIHKESSAETQTILEQEFQHLFGYENRDEE